MREITYVGQSVEWKAVSSRDMNAQEEAALIEAIRADPADEVHTADKLARELGMKTTIRKI